MQFSTRALLAFTALVAFACFVWVAPPIVRVPVLFVSVVIIPAPLAVVLRHGSSNAQTFALGALVAYAAWLVLAGIPCGVFVAYRFLGKGIPDESNIRWIIERFVGSYYPAYVGLYAPWIIVASAGGIALIARLLLKKNRYGERDG
jgi:hypothetical protein